VLTATQQSEYQLRRRVGAPAARGWVGRDMTPRIAAEDVAAEACGLDKVEAGGTGTTLYLF
jgi:hypothetical protein